MAPAGPEDLAAPPFAAALTTHHGSLAADGAYDTVHFDRLEFDAARAPGTRFLECAFTQVSCQRCQLRRAQFTHVWLRDCRLVSTSLAETGWLDATIAGGVWAGVEAFGARLRRVVLRGCKLDSVNFREAHLTDVVFDRCLLRDADFGGATLTRVAFPGCTLTRASLRQVTLDAVDLRGAELGIILDPGSLRGAIVTSGQLTAMAPLLAESLGIVVDDGPEIQK